MASRTVGAFVFGVVTGGYYLILMSNFKSNTSQPQTSVDVAVHPDHMRVLTYESNVNFMVKVWSLESGASLAVLTADSLMVRVFVYRHLRDQLEQDP